MAITNDNIEYSNHHEYCSLIGEEYKVFSRYVLSFGRSSTNLFQEEVLFPGNPCRPGGNIEFLQNGDMELLDLGVTLTYGEFCVEQNLPVSKLSTYSFVWEIFFTMLFSFRMPQT